jgi:WD40 repeat protein
MQPPTREPLVPTLDADVRSGLRAAGAPIQLFAEGPAQRRHRLRMIMSEQQWLDIGALYRACGVKVNPAGNPSRTDAQSKEQYSRGAAELTDLRKHLLQSSVARSQVRLQQQKLDSIMFHQLGAEKLQGRLVAMARSTLLSLARRMTAMNVGIERIGCGEDDEAHPLRVGITTVASLPSSSNSSGGSASLGSTIVTGDAAGVVTVWNAHTGQVVVSHHLHALGYGRVNSIVGLPQQPRSFLACARNKASVSLLRLTDDEESATRVDMTELASSSVPHRGVFHRLASDPTGTLVAASSNDCLVRVWDARTASPTFAYALDGLVEGRKALDVAFHPDGSLLSVTDAAGRCTTWDQRSGKCVFSTWHVPHTCAVASCVAWSPNGIQFATGGTDHAIHVWDARALAMSQRDSLAQPSTLPLLTIVPHYDVVTSLSFVPLMAADGFPGSASVSAPLLCSTSLDGTVKFHDVLCSGRTIHSVSTNFAEGGVRSHCWSTTPSGARQLIAVTCARHWTSWSTDVEGHEGLVANDVTVARAPPRVTGAPPTAAVGSVDAADDDDDDDDDMAALRKPPAAPAPPATAEADDDDDDDMASLRRR